MQVKVRQPVNVGGQTDTIANSHSLTLTSILLNPNTESSRGRCGVSLFTITKVRTEHSFAFLGYMQAIDQNTSSHTKTAILAGPFI